MPDEFYKVLPSLLWAGLAAALFLTFSNDLRSLVRHLVWRIKAGAPLKTAWFEVNSPYVSHDEKRNSLRGIADIREDTDGIFDREREPFRTTNRNLFLVHRLAPSRDETQLYDVMIYVVPSLKYGSLEGVLSVEYYFGKYWGRKIYQSIDRASGFSISTSAWAPFSCTAKIQFTDGHSVYLHRYVDFEMGAVGSVPFRAADA